MNHYEGHTKGPWRYEASTKTIRAVPGNHWLASIDSWDGTPNHAANARLIAAAPDLLRERDELREALESALVAMTTTRIVEGVSPFMATAIEHARAILARIGG